MSFLADLFGRRKPARPTHAPDAYRAFADAMPSGGLARGLLHWAADVVTDTIEALRLSGLPTDAVPAPDSPEAALGSAVVMAAEEFIAPALLTDASSDLTRGHSDYPDEAGILLGMLVAFNLACQVKTDLPSLETQDVITAAFQTFSLNREPDQQAAIAPLLLDAFRRVFSSDDALEADVAVQVFEYVTLVIAHVLGDESVGEGALSFEALAMLPDVRQIVARP
jgi:hypothetical protein